MSWHHDIYDMHYHFGTDAWVRKASPEDKIELLKLRMRMLGEEYMETMNAYLAGDEEEIIDGLIDLCVIAIGTLDLTGVNPQYAWEQVVKANMAKQVGVKPGRPNPLGLPDLVKPSGWRPPDHSKNKGRLKEFL